MPVSTANRAARVAKRSLFCRFRKDNRRSGWRRDSQDRHFVSAWPRDAELTHTHTHTRTWHRIKGPRGTQGGLGEEAYKRRETAGWSKGMGACICNACRATHSCFS